MARGFGKRSETLDHQRQRRFVETPRIVEQNPARFADKAGAQRTAGKEWNEGGFKRVRQCDDLVVMFFRELARKAVTPQKRKFAVSERARQRRVDFRHAREQRVRPWRRQHVERESRVTFVQSPEERLCENRIANPGRGYDEDYCHQEEG